MHTIEFLTEKTNRYTRFYCLLGIVVAPYIAFLGVRWIISADGLDALAGVAGVVIGILITLSTSWNLWVMMNEVIGVEVDGESNITLLRPSGQMQRNVQLGSRLFTFGCIRFGAPNDLGRLDYALVRTSVGAVAIPVELLNKVEGVDNAKLNSG